MFREFLNVLSKFILLLAQFLYFNTFAQKEIIGNDDVHYNWKLLGVYGISDDGKYVYYNEGSTVNIVSPMTTDRFIAKHATEPQFVESKYFICRAGIDSIMVLNLQTKKQTFFSGIERVKATTFLNQNQIICLTKFGVEIRDLENLEEKLFYKDFNGFTTNHQGTVSILKKKDGLYWLDHKTGFLNLICNLHGDVTVESGELCQFNILGNEILFQSKNRDSFTLFHYKRKLVAPRAIVSDVTTRNLKGLILVEGNFSFTPNSDFVCFSLRKTSVNTDALKYNVNIWSYKDRFLPAIFGTESIDFTLYKAVASINDFEHRVILLENDSSRLIRNCLTNQYGLVSNVTEPNEAYWNEGQSPKYKLVKYKDGTSKDIFPTNHKIGFVTISPDKRFIMWNDTTSSDIYSYELESGKIRNTTSKIFVQKDILSTHGRIPPSKFAGIDTWSTDVKKFFIHDYYDVWEIDPFCKISPINLTNRFGRKNKIRFRIPFSEKIKVGDIMLLTALDTLMRNGLWIVKSGISDYPKQYFMTNHLYSFETIGTPIIRSAKSSKFLYAQQSVAQAPNLYFSDGGNVQVKLTEIAPQKNYNWMTSELVIYPMGNGISGRGVLYKPENFDANKKYPIIFYCYQNESRELNLYKTPGTSGGRLSIPWYVSNGYLVFQFDILNYQAGKIKESSVNSAEYAVRYFEKFPWVNTKKIGLQGHSFGGFETNLIIANCNLFAAAQCSAGMSNLISGAGIPTDDGDQHAYYERGQVNLWNSMWERPDIYIKNSPVLQANQITTPLLLEHGESDPAVPFNQAMELFTAMRRLKKKVWLISYKGQGHGLIEDQARDYTLRQQQFFDFYLKDNPAPLWMLETTPKKHQGTISGFQLDSLIRIP